MSDIDKPKVPDRTDFSHLEYAKAVAGAIPSDVDAVARVKKEGDTAIDDRMNTLTHLSDERVKIPPSPSGERLLYKQEAVTLMQLAAQAVDATNLKDQEALQVVGQKLKTALTLQIPDSARFTRFTLNDNKLRIYYNEPLDTHNKGALNTISSAYLEVDLGQLASS